MAAILTSGNTVKLRVRLFTISRRALSKSCCSKTLFQTSTWTPQRFKFMDQKHLSSTALDPPTSVKIPPNLIQESLSNNNKERVTKKLKEMEKIKFSSCSEEAAVLIPFCTVGNKPSLLFTLRSSALTTHRGQVSFPGGKRDKDDKSLVDTAIRETVEETGIKENIIDIWGTLPPVPDRKGKSAVTGVVSFLGEIDVDCIEFNHNEVSKVFHLTLEHILENRRYTKFSNGITMPVFVNGPHLVWGMTATMMDFFFEILFPGYYKKVFAYSDRTKLPWLSKVIRHSKT